MLVLTRKCLEVIVVGGGDGTEPLVKVTVLGVENGKVRLGIEAAGNIPVHRLEVWERMHGRLKAALDAAPQSTVGPPASHDLWP